MKSDDISRTSIVPLTDFVEDVLLDIRYFSTYNFVGERIDGYMEPCALITQEAALALKNVSDQAGGLGFRLKIFDTYRPVTAVNHFERWAKDFDDVRMKKYFYPDVDKSRLFELGYISSKSAHSRGSTVDLTLFDMSSQKDIDMGSAFDFFDGISHSDTVSGLSVQQIKNRELLKSLMCGNGFIPIREEWWHFTLQEEPYPDFYFDFPVKRC